MQYCSGENYVYDEYCLNHQLNINSLSPTQLSQDISPTKLTKEYLKLTKKLNKSRGLRDKVYIDHETLLNYVKEVVIELRYLSLR